MHQYRIFIAINFPKKIREQLFDLNANWHEFPFRFTRKEDLHITLVFIGALDEEYLLKTLEALKRVGSECEPFEIKLTDATLAPTATNAKYIWLNTDAPKELESLHKKITSALRDAGVRFKLDYYPYRPHITLARRTQNSQTTMQNSRQSDVLHVSLNLTVKVNSFEVMESFLSLKGARYQIIQSYTIGAQKGYKAL